MQDKSAKILKEHTASLVAVAKRLPAYDSACTALIKTLSCITDPKWITRNLAYAKLNVVKIYNSDQETIEFKSINEYPLFAKEQAGDKRLRNVPRPLTQKTCLELREAFLAVGRRPLPAHSVVMKTVPQKVMTDPEHLDFSKDPHGGDLTYRKAVKRAIELFHEQYSMLNCVKIASEQTGYKVKARIERGFRSQLSPGEIEVRRVNAKAAHGYSSTAMPQSARSMFREIRVNENHFKEIARGLGASS